MAELLDKYVQLVFKKRITPIQDIENIQVMRLKGWLFNFYMQIENFEKYNLINKRTLKYKSNIREIASIEDISL